MMITERLVATVICEKKNKTTVRMANPVIVSGFAPILSKRWPENGAKIPQTIPPGKSARPAAKGVSPSEF